MWEPGSRDLTPIPVRVGDYDLNGYPDLLVSVWDSGTGDTGVELLENVACGTQAGLCQFDALALWSPPTSPTSLIKGLMRALFGEKRVMAAAAATPPPASVTTINEARQQARRGFSRVTGDAVSALHSIPGAYSAAFFDLDEDVCLSISKPISIE